MEWLAERLLAGWIHGPRDDARLRHPDLVPFGKVGEQIKEYDRVAIRNRPLLLRRAGNLTIAQEMGKKECGS